MNIAHMTNVIDGRENSGTARAAREIIFALAKHPEIHQTFIHFKKSDDPIYKLPGVSEIVIPLKPAFFAKHFWSFFFFWFKNVIRKQYPKFDVVHWHASRVFPFFFLIPCRRTIITLHDANTKLIPGAQTVWTRMFHWNLLLSQHWYFRILGDSFDACRKLALIGKFPKAKIECLYLGSNFNSLEPMKPLLFDEKDGYIVCVSRWQPYKNLVNLIEGYKVALDSNSKVPKLILVGKPVGEYSCPLKKIEELGLSKHVKVYQDLSDNELAYLYDHAAFSCAPSLYEGFGLAVLESMMRKCPVVVHFDTATAEIAGEAGIKIDMRLPSEIAKSINKLIEEPSALKQLREQASLRSRNFTWEKTANRLLSIYLK